ncbi:MAG: T9SS type A sorting domain-containing protein [Flavobacteriaceae bacterium]|jgi:hypothetical protein|nr:T9SS type A sorting domain-containing protein [Flavobacteriaceae bacterium]
MKTLKQFLTALALFGLSAGAANAQVCSIGSTNYTTLDDALAAVPTGGATPTTIKLLADINYNNPLDINNKKITFDMNNKNLKVYSTSTNTMALSAHNGGQVFMTGSGDFTVWSTATPGTYANAYPDKVTVTNSYGSDRGVYARQGAEINIRGDISVIGYNGIGVLAEAGGPNPNTKITVDGIISAPSTGTYIRIGTTDYLITEYAAVTTKSGYRTYTDGVVSVWVKGEDPICQIVSTGKKYFTLTEALAAATSGDTIKLLADVNHDRTIDGSNKSINFDLNGFDLNVEATTNADSKGLNVLYGNVGFEGGEFHVIGMKYGVYTEDTAEAHVSSATANSNGGAAVFASGDYTYVVIDHDANALSSAGGIGAQAENRAEINIGGNVLSEATTAAYVFEGAINIAGNVTAATIGADARNSGSIHIGGNITADEIGAFAEGGSMITVDGSITAPIYIKVGTEIKTPADFTTPTTKPDYLTYTDGTSTIWVKDTGAAATENIYLQNLKIYPNPVQNELQISDYTGNGTYSIFDFSGKQILSGKLSNDKSTINVSSLAPGVYVLKININGETAVRKMIKR